MVDQPSLAGTGAPGASPARTAAGEPAPPGVTVEATATFLFSDIAGSTRLWEDEPEAMAASLEAHDAILRDAVVDHGGVVVKTTGDGLLARFDDPVGALQAAVSAQRTLTGHDWDPRASLHVRMAIHTGSAQARDGDYFGPSLNRAARLLAVGHGGQVLVSGVAAVLARDRLPNGVGLRDLGEHRLRDLEWPEHVYQLTAPDLDRDFPALRSLGSSLTNLPVQLTSFVGRDRELAALRELCRSSRLVTLVGTGGTGKTRLMLQVAIELLDWHPGGVWLVELAPLADPALVPPEIARVLGVREEPHRALVDTIVDFLRSNEVLLLLDNCEHLVSAVAALADRLLHGAPSLAILATSREALGVEGEHVFPVPSLGLPAAASGWSAVAAPRSQEPAAEPAGVADETARDADEMVQSEAVRLFVDRATAVVPTFELTAANVAAVAEICRRLDGIPLAIELAAARVTVLSPEDIAARLGDRFRLLTGGRRTALPRQQTLQATIDWSWELLSEDDRHLLRDLSVFAGGWTLEAAVAVATEPGAGGDPGLDTLDGLDRLAARSLVQVDRGAITRYRMLETIRQYARDRLVESGEADDVRARHLAFFRDLALAAEPALSGPAMVDWLDRLAADADNFRAAIEWAFEAEPETTLRLVVALELYWETRALGSESLAWFQDAVELAGRLPPPDPSQARERALLVARVLAAAATIWTTWGMAGAARRWATEAVALARRHHDDRSLLRAIIALVLASVFTGRPETMDETWDEAHRLATRLDDWYRLAFMEAGMALHLAVHDPSRADDVLEAAATSAARSGNPFAIAFVAVSRGRALGMLGRTEEARAAFDTAMTGYGALGDRRFALSAKSELAHALRLGGARDEAAAIYRHTIREWERLGNRGAIANQLEVIAFLAMDGSELERAARLLGAAASIREEVGAGMLPHEQAEYERMVGRLRGELEQGTLDREWRAGSQLDVGAAIDLALSS